MLDLRLSPEQVEATETLRKSEANQLRGMGYRETKSLSPVQGPPRNLPCIDFDVFAPAIPTVQVLDDPPSVGQASHSNQTQNPVVVDPSELPSAAYLSLPERIALNFPFVHHLFSGQRQEHDFRHEFETLAAQQINFLGDVLVLSIDFVLHPQ